MNFSIYKIKNLLQQIRENDFPSNNEIPFDIWKIRLNFDNFDLYEEGVLFCLSKGEYINLRYKNRVEKYIIFTSLYQLKIAADCGEFFLDGTFKSARKGYYQMLNQWGYRRNKNVYLPISNNFFLINLMNFMIKLSKKF